MIVVGYLPPENSPWGRDATGFMAHILQLLYLHSHVSDTYVMGDFNAHLGNSDDCIDGIDEISKRTALDHVRNGHGPVMLDLLFEGKLCVLNERLCTENDHSI